jgi:hypothetical protein
MTDSERQNVTNKMKSMFQADPYYAWEWHCAIAEGMRQAGCDPKLAHQGAARFMDMHLDVKVQTFAEYRHVMESWK